MSAFREDMHGVCFGGNVLVLRKKSQQAIINRLSLVAHLSTLPNFPSTVHPCVLAPEHPFSDRVATANTCTVQE